LEAVMQLPLLGGLAWRFATLSLVAIGGANAVVPELHRHAVEVAHWMSDAEFASLFAIAQAAPGPNVLIVTLIGWRVAGIPGALVATAAMIVPSSLLTFWGFRAWKRLEGRPWRAAVQNGVAPLTVGLVGAGGYLLATAADVGMTTGAVTVATAALSYFTQLNPLWAFGIAAGLGVALGP
jgi:chromate transporter